MPPFKRRCSAASEKSRISCTQDHCDDRDRARVLDLYHRITRVVAIRDFFYYFSRFRFILLKQWKDIRKKKKKKKRVKFVRNRLIGSDKSEEARFHFISVTSAESSPFQKQNHDEICDTPSEVSRCSWTIVEKVNVCLHGSFVSMCRVRLEFWYSGSSWKYLNAGRKKLWCITYVICYTKRYEVYRGKFVLYNHTCVILAVSHYGDN